VVLSLIRKFIAVAALVLSLAGSLAAQEIWRLDNTTKLGPHPVTVIGAPRVQHERDGASVVFDGANDGLLVAALPFAGARAYTIEILFWPAEGGLTEQRFFHAQDAADRRAMIETRLDGKGSWWLDTFIQTGAPGVTLVDRSKLHPTNRWYWAALRYDGTTMAHFINGRKELERGVAHEPFATGQISLGVRQNKVFWFKGAIREVRFHREPLPEAKLQRVD
jgi:hypothetical protein